LSGLYVLPIEYKNESLDKFFSSFNKMDHQRSKTVLILDHSSFFARPSGVTFNVNIQNTDQQQHNEINNDISLGMKSLWTCVVECVLEYCRILFDIFEDDALVC
jgi:hypothetical protein